RRRAASLHRARVPRLPGVRPARARPKPDFPGVLPMCTVAVFAVAALVVRRRGRERGQRYLAACLLLAAGGYLSIALGRGGFYAPNPMLLGNASRYQYVGPILIAIAWCVMLAELAPRIRLGSTAKSALVALAIAPIVFGYLALERPLPPEFGWSRW